MKVYVYTPLNTCYQLNKEMVNKNTDMYEYGNYETNNFDVIIIKEILNSIFLRIIMNLSYFSRFWFGPNKTLTMIINERKKIKKENKNATGFIFAPLFNKRCMIEIQPISCNNDTILKIYRQKGRMPFAYEVLNGEVELKYNGKIKKKSI
jgi:hypothetical protein